jgi:dihydropteroate synthase
MTARRRSFTVPLPGRDPLHLGERCLVMGILNVTPDSFAESPHIQDPDAAADAALRMEAQGADLIDLGGESTRPGADPVSAADELARVMPVIERLRGRLTVPLSIDTYKASVARTAVSAGAVIINDVTGLRHDPEMAATAADTGAALVVMHSRGSSKTMYGEAVYDDVVRAVTAELRESLALAERAGVPLDRIVVDPGLGFAKRAPHSYGVLARLTELADAVSRPLLVGPSRKSFMRDALGDRPPAARDWGSAAAVTAAVLGGAHIVRVHNVEAMVQVVRVAEDILRSALT